MEGSRERDEGGTKVPWIVGGALVVFLILAGSLAGGSSSSSMSMMPMPPPTNARGVLLPADGVDRTVIVPSCGTPASVASQTAPGGSSGEGVVTLRLGGSSGMRAILVPDCMKPSGGAPPPGAPPPSAAFVLPVGTTQLQDSSAQVGSRSQVIIPAGSRAKTVVVPACVTGGQAPAAAKKQDVVLSPKRGADSATAPSC